MFIDDRKHTLGCVQCTGENTQLVSLAISDGTILDFTTMQPKRCPLTLKVSKLEKWHKNRKMKSLCSEGSQFDYFSAITRQLMNAEKNTRRFGISKPTSIWMNFIQRVLSLGQHLHVRTKLFHQCIGHIRRCFTAGYSDTLGGHFRARVLEEEPHNTSKLQILRTGKSRIQTWTYYPWLLPVPWIFHSSVATSFGSLISKISKRLAFHSEISRWSCSRSSSFVRMSAMLSVQFFGVVVLKKRLSKFPGVDDNKHGFRPFVSVRHSNNRRTVFDLRYQKRKQLCIIAPRECCALIGRENKAEYSSSNGGVWRGNNYPKHLRNSCAISILAIWFAIRHFQECDSDSVWDLSIQRPTSEKKDEMTVPDMTRRDTPDKRISVALWSRSGSTQKLLVKPGFHMIASIVPIVRKTWDDRGDHMETLGPFIRGKISRSNKRHEMLVRGLRKPRTSFLYKPWSYKWFSLRLK